MIKSYLNEPVDEDGPHLLGEVVLLAHIVRFWSGAHLSLSQVLVDILRVFWRC